jgi:hypothetical protein
VYLRSKGKDSEWWNFGGERLLGAVNGDELKGVALKKSKSAPLKITRAAPDTRRSAFRYLCGNA